MVDGYATGAAAAETRAALYRLFASLWLEELDAELLELLRAWPAGSGSDWPSDPKCDEPVEATLAALRPEWTRVFVLTVPLYESLFVDEIAMLNTDATQRVVDEYERFGWGGAGARTGALDHLGVELRFLGQLAAEEALALRAADAGAARGFSDAAAGFLARHPLRWAPVALLAIERCGGRPRAGFPGYPALARGCREFLLEEAERLLAGARPNPAAAPVFELKQGTELEVQADGGPPDLRATAAHLATPARSGLFLSRHDLATLARRLALPLRIGDRAATLRDLLEAALGYGRGDALSDALDGWIGWNAAGYLDWANRFPATAPIWRDWARRAETSRRHVSRALLAGERSD